MATRDLTSSPIAGNGPSSDTSDDSDWADIEADEEAISFVSLFDSTTFQLLDTMLDHCEQHHNFNLRANVARLQLDFMGAVKLVNFIRHRVRSQKPLPAAISHHDIDDDTYLVPVLENDSVLFSLEDVLGSARDSDGDHSDETTNALQDRNAQLEAELELIRRNFMHYRLDVERTLDRRWGDEHQHEPKFSSPDIEIKDQSDYYFESYASNEIHETMLKDQVRTDAYRDFIYENKHLFKDKVVLDIGCGTGILSMFCATAGAAQVIAVDKSEIIIKARENIFNNGLSAIVTCLSGAIEDVKLPVDKVDIIVSEWMGYCLLYEAMLPSVLYARDKYLKPGGLLVPSSATLWIAPVDNQNYCAEHVSYWRDVYGFDMKAMQEGIFDDVRIEAMPAEFICGSPFPFKTFDLRKTRTEDLVFTADWQSDLTRNIESIDGFLIWFDNFFATSGDEQPPAPQMTTSAWVKKKPGNVAFTTGPYGTETHWKQGFLLIDPKSTQTNVSTSSQLSGQVTFAVLEENARALTIDAQWSVADQKRASQSWKLR
ncbi:protein arginine N-methyltransferase [Drechmeria coniospora]|uniref:type I protein arginine methyltransferase n=1 Tax=Drechmeria coniospora TaxID=98403 RepID=A0A151GBU6_DRECN|nr:protein arginine N-methyltransferase [Drechmeria coniospora]KYK54521.1 protein arginine N-methyltransferase [Drechmeria coniospora]